MILKRFKSKVLTAFALAQLFKAGYTDISVISIKLSKESFKIFLWKLFKKIRFIKNLVFWKKNEKWISIKFWRFVFNLK